MATLKVTNIKNESFAGDQLYLKTDGKIGIGTTDPDAPLTIHNSADPEIRFGYNASQDHRIAWDSSKIYIHADPDNANGSSALALAVDGTSRLYINDSGNVGIGTTSPDTNLEINGGADAIAKVTGTTTAARLDLKTNSHHRFIQTLESDGAFRVYDQTNNSERLRITSDGKVGIGTTSPTAELDIERTTGTVEVQLQSRDSSDCFVSFGDNSDSDIGQIRYAHSDNSMSFKTNTNERLSIDFEGKVIMGSGGITTDSSERFFVDGSGANDHCGLGIKTNNATYDGFIAFHDTDTNNQGAIRYTHSQDRMKFRTGGNNERICLDSDGLKFHGDTAAANALNDYEEGTFTPTIGFASNSANDWTYNAQQGTYIKVGNLCHFVLRIDIGNAGSGNDGWVEIAGLPFGMYNMMSGISYEGTCNCDVHDAASNITGPRAIIYQSANKLMLINSNSTDSFFASGNQISKSDLIQASTDIRIRGTYRTT